MVECSIISSAAKGRLCLDVNNNSACNSRASKKKTLFMRIDKLLFKKELKYCHYLFAAVLILCKRIGEDIKFSIT